MKYLTIIRHAKSKVLKKDLDDLSRSLNSEGKSSISLVGKFLKKKKSLPDFILTSPAKRALKTASGIGKAIKSDVEPVIEEVIYSGNENEIFELIKRTDTRYSDVFLFGHEPMLSSLVSILTGKKLLKMPASAACRIGFDLKNWSDMNGKAGKCEFYMTPKKLAES